MLHLNEVCVRAQTGSASTNVLFSNPRVKHILLATHPTPGAAGTGTFPPYSLCFTRLLDIFPLYLTHPPEHAPH